MEPSMEALIRMERIEKFRSRKFETPWIQNLILLICIIISIILIINYDDIWIRGSILTMIILFMFYVGIKNLRMCS